MLIANVGLLLSSLTLVTARPHSRDVGLGLLNGALGIEKTFDYVIVGAGNAGLPLAYRLAEDPKVTVALIEAGTYYELSNPILSSAPGGDVVFCGSSPLDDNPFVDWNFITEPQTGAANRRVHYARGRALGGCTARNFMIYQRATRGSLDMWADETGDDSYRFDAMLPWYQKSVNFTAPDMSTRMANASADWEPTDFVQGAGPLRVSYSSWPQTFSTWMERGLNAIGMAKRKGFNSGSLVGTAFCASTIDPTNGHRASSQETFLSDAQNRGLSNLHVYQLSTAKKILFDATKTATGVQVAAAGLLPWTLHAAREVIVSAGAFQSPQLLMVSGIGPRDQLEPLNIDIVHENPNVGQNMWDHVFAGPTYQVHLETFTKVAADPVYLALSTTDFLTNRTGPLNSPVADFLGWERIPDSYRARLSAATQNALSIFPSDWPELEYISGAGYVGDFSNLLLNQPHDGRMYGTILSTLVAPLSRGNVSISSADTSILPRVNPNWLTHPADQEVAIVAFKRAREAFLSSGMSPITVGEEYFPGPNAASDADILENYRRTLMTVWHAACTNKMGRSDDPTAVVDSKARVIGVKRLRVVDASSFAILPPGHPMSMIYAFAEKIADDIKKDNA